MTENNSISNPQKIQLQVRTIAEGFLALLRQRGIKYFFANAGTDFPPIVEAFARSQQSSFPVPKPITVPHESAAVGMAIGYFLVTGNPQAVMVHVNVGTANALGNLINASREGVPLLLIAGRNPVSEKGPHGTRTAYIQWPQEAFDQGGIVREYVKWEYELRQETELETFVDRALQVMQSEPCGPSYLTLPREALARNIDGIAVAETSLLPPAAAPAADPEAIKQAAEMIVAAKFPIIVTNTIGKDPSAVDSLIALTESHSLPVVQPFPRYMNFPDSHLMNLGYGIENLLNKTDLMLLVDCDVPWIPSRQTPNAECQFIHLGIDPEFAKLPLRGFPAHLILQTASGTGLQQLDRAISKTIDSNSGWQSQKVEREKMLLKLRQNILVSLKNPEPLGADGRISPAWATQQIFDLCGPDAIYFNEYPLQRPFLNLTRPRSFFSQPPAGALGWGLGAALGAKLAMPERLIVAALGDGAYFFNNPAVMHFLSNTNHLPILILIFNNERWQAVRGSTMQMYPEGFSALMNEDVPLSGLKPSPAFEMYVKASGGLGIRVEDPNSLCPALKEAIDAVRKGKQTLLNIQT